MIVTPARKRVVVFSRKEREFREMRDDAIREMAAEGASLRAIAAYADLSHTTVANIVKRST